MTDTAWDEARARATIETIAAEVDASFDDLHGCLTGRAGMPLLDVF